MIEKDNHIEWLSSLRQNGFHGTCIDLFVGAGGLSEGFKMAGFEVLAANDFDEHCAATFRLNNPNIPFFLGPIEKIKAGDFLEAARIRPGQIDCVIGGPPCQAFSVYNHQRGMHDERSGLFKEYLRIVEGLMPRFVVMENVPGMTSVEGGRAVQEIKSGLSRLGYKVENKILKAEEFGVPQERRRMFFIGSLDHEIRWPLPTHGRLGSGLPPFTTVHDAISDLPTLENAEGTVRLPYTKPAVTSYQKFVREGSRAVYNHVAPSLSSINLERMRHIPPGGSWRDIPVNLLPAGMKRARRSDHTKRYGRLHPEGLACTILTKCDPHWGAFFHPEQDRAITVREAARLQSFPDAFRFAGPKAEQYRQVGNAVPVILAAVMATSIILSLRKKEAI
jgi:DNA (cytosine-5)-methyltransferase 1